MSGFPMAWEAAIVSQDILIEQCPYSIPEIEKYMQNCRYHLMLLEEPSSFRVLGPVATKIDNDRKFWLYEAFDAYRRQWLIVVGTGKSCFKPNEKMKRWMYAKTNDTGLSPEEFLGVEYDSQIFVDSRK